MRITPTKNTDPALRRAILEQAYWEWRLDCHRKGVCDPFGPPQASVPDVCPGCLAEEAVVYDPDPDVQLLQRLARGY